MTINEREGVAVNTVTEDAIRQHLHTTVFGRDLQVAAVLPSTNTTARELAQSGAPEGTVVVAAAQTAGRGTRSRAFFSPQGGVYMSIILRPREADGCLITSCAAVAVARAIERLCPLNVQIKWVNDLYIGGRKLCGILTEAGFAPDNSLDFVVLGIGVNVATTTFPPELAALATSLGNEGCAVERAALIAAILEEWERAYATIGSGEFLAESRARSCVLGRRVTVTRGSEQFTATARDINDRGHLLVQKDDGDTVTLLSGEVSIRI